MVRSAIPAASAASFFVRLVNRAASNFSLFGDRCPTSFRLLPFSAVIHVRTLLHAAFLRRL